MIGVIPSNHDKMTSVDYFEHVPVEILQDIFLYCIDLSSLPEIRQSVARLKVSRRWRKTILDLIPKISMIFGVDIIRPIEVHVIKHNSEHHWRQYNITRCDCNTSPVGLIKKVIVRDRPIEAFINFKNFTELVGSQEYYGLFKIGTVILYNKDFDHVRNYNVTFEMTKASEVPYGASISDTVLGPMLIQYSLSIYQIYLLSKDHNKAILIMSIHNGHGTLLRVTWDYIVMKGSQNKIVLIDHKDKSEKTIDCGTLWHSSFITAWNSTAMFFCNQGILIINDITKQERFRTVNAQWCRIIADAVLFDTGVYHLSSNSLIPIPSLNGIIRFIYKEGGRYHLITIGS